MYRNRLPLIVFLTLFCSQLTVGDVLSIRFNNSEEISYSFLSKPVLKIETDHLLVKIPSTTISYPLSKIEKIVVNKTESLKDIVIEDDLISSFVNERNIANSNITYIRTFENTEWQALYIPFEISYGDWEENFEIAAISNIQQYDDDGNGLFDRMYLEIYTVKNETLLPNHPYLIRAKNPGKKTIRVFNKTLYATAEANIDCSSVDDRFVFSGTYNEFVSDNNLAMYSVKANELSLISSVGAFRWYMLIEKRNSQFAEKTEMQKMPSFTITLKESLDGLRESPKIVRKKAPKRNENSKLYSVTGRLVTQKSSHSIYFMQMKDGSSRRVIIQEETK